MQEVPERKSDRAAVHVKWSLMNSLQFNLEMSECIRRMRAETDKVLKELAEDRRVI